MFVITAKNVNPVKMILDLEKHQQFVSKNKWENIDLETQIVDVMTLVFDDCDEVLVQQIIDAHDPTSLPPQPTAEDFNLEIDFRVTMLELLGGM